MVMWTHLTVVLCVHCLSNYVNSLLGICWFTLEFELRWSCVFVELILETSCVLTVLYWMHEIIKGIKFELSAAVSLFFLVHSYENEYFVCMSSFARHSMQLRVVHISVFFLLLRLVGDWFVWVSLLPQKKFVEEFGVEHTKPAFLMQASSHTNLVLLLSFQLMWIVIKQHSLSYNNKAALLLINRLPLHAFCFIFHTCYLSLTSVQL